ncbi:MAG: glycosyltransferase family 87 protein, partial [Pseudomonadota bacterium]
MTADAIDIPATSRSAGAGDQAPPSQALPAVLIAGLLLSAVFVAFLYLMRGEAMFALPDQISGVHNEDFLAFWRAGVMSLNGEASSVYNTAAFLAPLPEAAAGLRFLNPPHFLLALAPLGLLPYGAAKFLFLILNLLSLAALAKLITDAAPRLQNRYAAVFFLLVFSPAMFASLLVMQIGPFVALLLAGGLLLARRRPIVAGLLLALLTMKPQFGLMAPLFLAAQGNWRAIIATVIWTAALCLGATMAFGVELWAAFLKSLSTVHAVHASLLHRDMVTVAQAVRKLGAAQNIAYTAQIVAVLFAAALVWRSARRLRPSTLEARICDVSTAETVGLALLA